MTSTAAPITTRYRWPDDDEHMPGSIFEPLTAAEAGALTRHDAPRRSRRRP